MVKILCNTKEFDELLLDVMIQACGNQEGEFIINNMCLSTYKEACDYLTEKGYLTTTDGRIYKLKPKVNTRKEVNADSSQH